MRIILTKLNRPAIIKILALYLEMGLHIYKKALMIEFVKNSNIDFKTST